LNRKSFAFSFIIIQHVWQMEIRWITSWRPSSRAKGPASSIKAPCFFSITRATFTHLLFSKWVTQKTPLSRAPLPVKIALENWVSLHWARRIFAVSTQGYGR
jgi:hypothetical protein